MIIMLASALMLGSCASENDGLHEKKLIGVWVNHSHKEGNGGVRFAKDGSGFTFYFIDGKPKFGRPFEWRAVGDRLGTVFFDEEGDPSEESLHSYKVSANGEELSIETWFPFSPTSYRRAKELDDMDSKAWQ